MLFPWFAPPPAGYLWSVGAAFVLIPLLLHLQAWSLASFSTFVRAGKLSREQAIRRAGLIGRVSTALLALATGGTGTLVLWSSLWTPGALSIGAGLCLWGLVSVLPFLLYTLLWDRFIFPQSRVRIYGLARPTAQTLRNRETGLLLRYGQALLFIEALGLCYWLGMPGARWGLPIAVVLLRGAATYWAAPVHRRLNRTVPIRETSWAALEARIRAWAARAMVQVQAIDIQQAGAASVARDGRHGHALFLNAQLLEQTDWRQQDAIVGHELGHLRLGHRRITALIEMLKIGTQTALCVALNLASPPAWLASLAHLMALAPDWPTQLIEADLLLLGLSLLGLGIASISLLGRGRSHRIELACDRFSAELTGDPIAMMVALNTLRTLRGMPLKQRSRTHPPIEQRIQALAAYMREQRPAAPWARTLVPSKIPFALKHLRLTVPLDQVPPPGPIDAAPGNMVSAIR